MSMVLHQLALPSVIDYFDWYIIHWSTFSLTMVVATYVWHFGGDQKIEKKPVY